MDLPTMEVGLPFFYTTSESRRLPSRMYSRNAGVTNALPASWEEMGMSNGEGSGRWRGIGVVASGTLTHWMKCNSRSLLCDSVVFCMILYILHDSGSLNEVVSVVFNTPYTLVDMCRN
ncbi:hypothetical protein EVAR_61405_1 [Eumeta japonica]|uniref:Uncharacterized protein n=1 Tax=Eumeta variegata TaxID=151549 RepID=A0A4C1YYE5_EUMVA|nr:hypothetical protein EVAR_61405_1 [Eumeta japonica]